MRNQNDKYSQQDCFDNFPCSFIVHNRSVRDLYISMHHTWEITVLFSSLYINNALTVTKCYCFKGNYKFCLWHVIFVIRYINFLLI